MVTHNIQATLGYSLPSNLFIILGKIVHNTGYLLPFTGKLILNSQACLAYSYFNGLAVNSLIEPKSAFYGFFLDGKTLVSIVQQFRLGNSNQIFINTFFGYSIYYALFNNVLINTYYFNQSIKRGHFQRYLGSFTRLFGEDFRQDSARIYINKASLPELTPKLVNTAESVLVALLLRAMLYETAVETSKINILFFGRFQENNTITTVLTIHLIVAAARDLYGGVTNYQEKIKLSDF